MSMHWNVTSAQATPEVVAETREFLKNPVHFFAECQAVNAFENLVPYGHFLTPNGFPREAFTWNLWPRSPVIPGNALGNLADFAPDNSNAAVIATPEPASVFVLGTAAGLVALRARRRGRVGTRGS